MTAPKRDLVAQLAATATDLAPALGLPDADELLHSVCVTARRVFRAAACSIAELREDEGVLVYRTADGEGADEVRGMRLPFGSGVASYVASSGQALVVDQVRADPRFAADVADATGYVPTALLVVPIISSSGVVMGVLSLLDVDGDAVPPEGVLELAAAFADQAALALMLGTTVTRLGAVLLEAIADAAQAEDRDLAKALRRRAAAAKGPDADAAALAARFHELQRLGPGVTAMAGRIVDELVTYARASRRSSPVTIIPAWGDSFIPERLPAAPSLGLAQPITRAWAYGDGRGRGVKVAVVDSGVDGAHPAVGGVAGGVVVEVDASEPDGRPPRRGAAR